MAKQSSKIVYRTKDYSKFIRDKDNRATDENRALEESMRRYGWLDAYPAFVQTLGDKLVIKDGQHRFRYAVELGIEVAYVVVDGVEVSIPEINKAMRRWDLEDYVSSYASQGIKDYELLLDFAKRNNLSVGISAKVLSGHASSGSSSDAIRSGQFKIKCPGTAEEVVITMDTCRECGISWWQNTYFVSALVLAIKHSRAYPSMLRSKIRSHKALMVLQPTVMAFVEMLSTVYNRHTNTKSNVDIAADVRKALLEIKINAANEYRRSKKCS